jgi:RNA polymerase sigma-70 factor (ECF subfamily)
VRHEANRVPGLSPATPVDFEALYRQQFPYVFRTLRRLGVRPAEIDDLVQEVFTVVFRRLADYDPSRPAQPWLFGIAFRTASVHRRSRSRRIVEVFGNGDDFGDDAALGQDASVADRQARRIVLEGLEALDLNQRAVLVLHDIDGQAVPRIAETLGLPVNTVYSRLRAARARFASRVRKLRRRESQEGAA